jgi:hypothetical protein
VLLLTKEIIDFNFLREEALTLGEKGGESLAHSSLNFLAVAAEVVMMWVLLLL